MYCPPHKRTNNASIPDLQPRAGLVCDSNNDREGQKGEIAGETVNVRRGTEDTARERTRRDKDGGRGERNSQEKAQIDLDTQLEYVSREGVMW